jgi:hypothetical protein
VSQTLSPAVNASHEGPPSSFPQQIPTSLRFNPPIFASPSLLNLPIVHIQGYTGYTIELKPGCLVHHLWPSTIERYGEADELFRAYQGEEAGRLFVRNKLANHKSVGGLLCQQCEPFSPFLLSCLLSYPLPFLVSSPSPFPEHS